VERQTQVAERRSG